MIVYIVTSGIYSDYGIEAVTLDREKAEKFIAARHAKDDFYESYNIEEFDTDYYEIESLEESHEYYSYRGFLRMQPKPCMDCLFSNCEILFDSCAVNKIKDGVVYVFIKVVDENFDEEIYRKAAEKIAFDMVAKQMAENMGL